MISRSTSLGASRRQYKTMQAFLDSARGADIRPKRTASGSLIVRQGTKYRALVGASGHKTAAGKYWERITGSTLPSEAEAPGGAPVRRTNKEFLQVRGKERLLRTYDPVSNDWKYSRLGKQHYKTARMQYVVKVPSIHSGERSDNTAYTRRAFSRLIRQSACRQHFLRPSGMLRSEGGSASCFRMGC
jgi:hypothetical protein